MEELDAWVAMKIAIKGNQAAVARRGKGGKIGVSPVPGSQIEFSRPLPEQLVQAGRFSQQNASGIASQV